MRADVNRNRQKILEVARKMFAERKVEDVQLAEIAVAAGVGRTTLFRHVGSKDELVHQIYGERSLLVAEMADIALSYEDPFEGFAFMLGNLTDWLHEDRNLIGYSQHIHQPVETLATHRAIEAAFAPVLDRLWRAGVIWTRLRPEDLLPLMSFALRDPTDTDERRRHLYVELVLRGLRADRAISSA